MKAPKETRSERRATNYINQSPSIRFSDLTTLQSKFQIGSNLPDLLPAKRQVTVNHRVWARHPACSKRSTALVCAIVVQHVEKPIGEKSRLFIYPHGLLNDEGNRNLWIRVQFKDGVTDILNEQHVISVHKPVPKPYNGKGTQGEVGVILSL